MRFSKVPNQNKCCATTTSCKAVWGLEEKRNAKVQKKGQPSIYHSIIAVSRLWEINDSEGDQSWIKNKSFQFLARSAPVKIWKLWWEITSLYVTLVKDKWNHTFLEQWLIKIHAEIYKYFNGWSCHDFITFFFFLYLE